MCIIVPIMKVWQRNKLDAKDFNTPKDYDGSGLSEPKEISLKRCIELTEGSGYWQSDSVQNMLNGGQEVWTPFSIFYQV